MDRFLFALALLLLAGCATTPQDESRRLREIFDDSQASGARRYPLGAIYRGDPVRVGRFGDADTDALVAANEAAARRELAALERIDRGVLSGVDVVAYDTFLWQRTLDLRWIVPGHKAIWQRLPIDQFNGLHLDFPQLSSGSGAARYRTLEDFEDGLGRIDGYVAWIDRAIGRFREGIAAGIVHPRPVAARVLAQFEGMVAQGVEGSVFLGPVRNPPATLSAEDGEHMRLAYGAAVRDRILPAYVRMRDFLRDEYLPRTRDSVGLSALPGGAAYYEHLIEVQTTLRMPAAAIHALGLQEVARIRAEMEALRARVGFAGTLDQWFEVIRTDPKFAPASVEAVAAGYQRIAERTAAGLPKLFSRLPRTRLEMRPEVPYRERTGTAGRYDVGSADATRPGVFFFNTYDLPTRRIVNMESLYLHEALPGHHMQLSIARENAALPPFLRFRWNNAYVEGWGLYAETLGAELGLYTDPYQLFGALDQEMWRALRLVVDTGIHAFGWTREQAIAFMQAHSITGGAGAVVEVERYIAWPAQALAYKLGQLEFARLRAKSAAALGAKFDVRAFHDQVLETGALPMPILEAKIDGWIARGGR